MLCCLTVCNDSWTFYICGTGGGTSSIGGTGGIGGIGGTGGIGGIVNSFPS